MFESIVYILLAFLGLGFLIFIHELGHYFVAKKVGMRVEVFSIGFGKAICSWKRGDIRWQVGILPFGGYVKIAGMEKKGDLEPYDIEGGFFSKRPIDRMKVAFAGPFVNFIFAFLAFSLIFFCGGRGELFSRYTKKIGLVNRDAAIYERGVRAGDEIVKYNGRIYGGFEDLLYASALKGKYSDVEGVKVDYYRYSSEPFSYRLDTYSHKHLGNSLNIVGIQAPASFLIYDEVSKKEAPISESGIEKGDRIIWVDGEVIFSAPQLSDVLNDNTVFLTVERGTRIFHVKLPRVKVEDIEIGSEELEELNDWRFLSKIKNRTSDLFFIKYLFDDKGVVQKELEVIDEEEVFYSDKRNPFFQKLEKGDRIVAVNGKRVQSGWEILGDFQKRHSLIIVQRGFKDGKVSWREGDRLFDEIFKKGKLNSLIASIGKGEDGTEGDLVLLKRVEPIQLERLAKRYGRGDDISKMLATHRENIGKIKDVKKRALALKLFEREKSRLFLGIPSLRDVEVSYNPDPFSLFYISLKKTGRTLKSLVSGRLSPKWLMGPVGIVQVIQKSWSMGFLQALFWLGFISLNLGFVNLLPIPVLDGGHILISLFEMITKKRMKAKTMEKLIIPFFVLLIALFIFLTYNDIVRWVRGIFK